MEEKIPIRDYIPKEAYCVFCGKDNCDMYSVQGYSHYKCYISK